MDTETANNTLHSGMIVRITTSNGGTELAEVRSACPQMIVLHNERLGSFSCHPCHIIEVVPQTLQPDEVGTLDQIAWDGDLHAIEVLNAGGAKITSQWARSQADAQARIQDVLQRPGRYEFYRSWQAGGCKVRFLN